MGCMKIQRSRRLQMEPHLLREVTFCTGRVTLSSHINYRSHTQALEVFFVLFRLEHLTGQKLSVPSLGHFRLKQRISEITYSHIPQQHNTTPVTEQ